MRQAIPCASRPSDEQLQRLIRSLNGTPGTVCDLGDEVQLSSREREPDTWGHPLVWVRWRKSHGVIEVEA